MPTDPLSQLRDIHPPQGAGFWPPAPGWWLLALVLILAALGLGLWLHRRWRRNRWRRSALQELDTLARARKADSAWFQHLNQLLKRAAAVCHPQQHPLALSGADWVDFLCRTGGEPWRETFQALARGSWQPRVHCDPDQAVSAARQWLRRQAC